MARKSGPRAPRMSLKVSLPMFIAQISAIVPKFDLKKTTDKSKLSAADTNKVVAKYVELAKEKAEAMKPGSASTVTDKGARIKLANLQRDLIGELCVVDGKLAEKVTNPETNETTLPENGKEIFPILDIEGGAPEQSMLDILNSL